MLAIASADWPGVLLGVAAILLTIMVGWGVWSVRRKITAISAKAGPLEMTVDLERKMSEVHEQITDSNGGSTVRGAIEEIRAAVHANHDRLRGEMLRWFASSVEDRRNIHDEIGDIKHRVTRIERHLHLEGDQL